jgi:hypothetical protein
MKSSLWALVVVLASAGLAGAQSPAQGTWKVARTPDGRPDLQGVWTTQTYTPLQRPERYAGKEFLTEAEAAELTRILTQPGIDPLFVAIFGASDEERPSQVQQRDETHYDNDTWLRTTRPKALSSLRTSLITDPPNGRLPPLTPEGQARAAARRAAIDFDSHTGRPLQERCVAWTHEGPPMMPPAYNDVTRILQTPGYVVILREVSTNLPRIIPVAGPAVGPAVGRTLGPTRVTTGSTTPGSNTGHVEGRPHISERIRLWSGDSRGRWEGNTLVVETRNFNGRAGIQGASERTHLIERFTRVSADRIHYTFTVSDPGTWTTPWSAELPMMKADGQPFEYACHEGNRGVANILSGARAAERAAGR